MKLKNYEIYEIANSANGLFDKNVYIPVRANFFIQKNFAKLAAAAQEIEGARIKIIEHYGELDEETQQYFIPQEKIAQTQEELNELLNIEQDIDIKTFSIEALGNIELTTEQMQKLMFMITEED